MKKIEDQIKQQLENREIPVSENAWDKLSGMIEGESLTDETKAESIRNIHSDRWWLYPAAASVVILISLFVVNPFEKTEIREIQVVNSGKMLRENPVEENEMSSDEASAEIVSTAREPELLKVEERKSGSEINSTGKEKFVVHNKTAIVRDPTEKTKASTAPEIKLNLPQIESPQQIASNEVQDVKPKSENPAADGQVKKSKYVDAGMLLYSVENNQTISESKDNTKLVIIDFNK